MQKNSVAVIGLGYVGLPLAVLAEKKGYSVIGIVRNEKKATQLNKRIMPFKDKEIEKDLKKINLTVYTDYSKVKNSKFIIICVPTPIDSENSPDLSLLTAASKSLGSTLIKGQTVILESTVNPGVSDEVVIPILEEKSGLKVGKDFYYVHCPERINPGDTKWTVSNIPRVLGANDPKSLKSGGRFYKSILDGKITYLSSIMETEAVKIVENAFRDINIAFVNELAMSFSHLGIDVLKVINAAATKPFSFMPHYPGCGVGGHCIPVDPYYLINYAEKKGFRHDFLILARNINNSMPAYTVSLLKEALKDNAIQLKNSRISLLGLSYKANIDDTRESPSIKIKTLLKEEGMRVKTYDPYVLDSDVKSLSEALINCDAVIIATDHDEFKRITALQLQKNNITVVIDGRNILKKEEFEKHGINYKGIGR